MYYNLYAGRLSLSLKAIIDLPRAQYYNSPLFYVSIKSKIFSIKIVGNSIYLLYQVLIEM